MQYYQGFEGNICIRVELKKKLKIERIMYIDLA